MKNILILVFLLFIPITVSGQFSSNRIIDGDLIIQSTGQVTVPSGTTAQRSLLPVNGMLRYNQDVNEFEGFVNGVWDSIGGGLELTAKGNLIGFDGVDTKECVLDKTDGYLLTVSAASDCGFDFSPAPVSVPTTTKGDLSTHDGVVPARLGVGSDGSFLVADSAESKGLKWTDTLAGTFNPVTDWQDYTPTTQGVGSITCNKCMYRRVGSDIELHLDFITGAVTGDEIQLGLPSGLSVSSNLSSLTRVGYFEQEGNAGSWYTVLATGSDTYVNVGARAAATSVAFTPQTGSAILVSSRRQSMKVTVPIEGWTSGIDAISQFKTNTSVIAEKGSAQSITNNTFTTITYTETKDTSNSFSSGIFTSNKNAEYLFCAFVRLEATAWVQGEVKIMRISTSTGQDIRLHRREYQAANTDSDQFGNCQKIEMVIGETAELQVFQNSGATVNLEPDTDSNTLTITELPSSSLIGAAIDSQKWECEANLLTANITSDTVDIADLRKTDLVIGKNYKVSGGNYYAGNLAVNDTVSFSAIHDGNTLMTWRITGTNVSGGNGSISTVTKCFEATNSSLTFNIGSITSPSEMRGNNTLDQTHIEICKLPDNYVCP